MESLVWLLDTQPAACASHLKNLEIIRDRLQRVAYPRSVFVGDQGEGGSLWCGNARLLYAASGDMADAEAFRTMLVMRGVLTPQDTFAEDYDDWPNPSPLLQVVQHLDEIMWAL